MNESEDMIICPHCKAKHIDFEDFLEVGDMDGEFEMCCDNCNKIFEVNFHSVFIFTTK